MLSWIYEQMYEWLSDCHHSIMRHPFWSVVYQLYGYLLVILFLVGTYPWGYPPLPVH